MSSLQKDLYIPRNLIRYSLTLTDVLHIFSMLLHISSVLNTMLNKFQTICCFTINFVNCTYFRFRRLDHSGHWHCMYQPNGFFLHSANLFRGPRSSQKASKHLEFMKRKRLLGLEPFCVCL